MIILPVSGGSNPAIALRRVVFPEPDGPSSATRRFDLISRLMLSKAVKVPNFFDTRSMMMLTVANPLAKKCIGFDRILTMIQSQSY